MLEIPTNHKFIVSKSKRMIEFIQILHNLISTPTCPDPHEESPVTGDVASPTWHGDSDSPVPNDATPVQRRGRQMTLKQDRSNNPENQAWIAESGNKVHGSRETSIDFLYHAPLTFRNATT